MAKFPAQKVQCPHCAWQGSARGLFTHVRLAHPEVDTSSVKTRGKRITKSITTNPHAIGSNKPVATSSRLRSEDPFNTREWREYERENMIEAAGMKILWNVAIKLAEMYTPAVTHLGQIPEAEVHKPTTHGVVRKGPRKRGK